MTARAKAPLAPRLVASVLARILDRPNAAHYGAMARCDCDGCEAIRAAGMACTTCGFQGAPVVIACECREARADNITFARGQIAELRRLGVEQAAPGDFCLGDWLSTLHENETRPDAMCTPDTRDGYRPDTPHCSHGAVLCPTCGNDGSGEVRVSPEALAATIRALRGALRASVTP